MLISLDTLKTLFHIHKTNQVQQIHKLRQNSQLDLNNEIRDYFSDSTSDGLLVTSPNELEHGDEDAVATKLPSDCKYVSVMQFILCG